MRSQEGTVFSTEDMNDPLERERLVLQKRRDNERNKAVGIWEEMGSRAQVKILAVGQS